jgi:nicotinic acid mononucleotide adenylyltransferase
MSDRQNVLWETRFAAASAKLADSAHLLETSQRIHAAAGNADATAEAFGHVRLVPTGGRCVGLFAGTFNPLTLAHIALVESAMLSGGIDRMLWILAVASIDKETVARATLVDRLVQLEAYVATVQQYGVLVVNRGLYVEQVNLAYAQLSGDDELVVLVGYDKILQILDPRYYKDRTGALDELFQRARFLVAPRGTATSDQLEALLAKPENRPYSSRVSYLSLASRYRDDSATDARLRAAVPGVTAVELGQFLAPEGAALALETGAFVVPPPDAAQDKYLWRSAWIAALGATPSWNQVSLPDMKRLVQATVEPDERGQSLRSALQTFRASPYEIGELMSLLGGV